MIFFPIVEVFESLQGEGYNVGMAAIFIRFGGCNLACPWCDTEFNHFQKMSIQALLDNVRSFSAKTIIVTGGEPTLQKKLPFLLTQLKVQGYFIAIESNGLGSIPDDIDYIALSPKFIYRDRYRNSVCRHADEVRIVVENHPEFYEFCLMIEDRFPARRYFLSPCEENNQFNMLTTLQMLGKINQHRQTGKWRLSIQAHKLANIE